MESLLRQTTGAPGLVPLNEAEACLMRGDLDNAQELFSAALDNDPAHGHLGLARCAQLRGELHAALGHLQAVELFAPDHAALGNDLGVVYSELGQFAQAYRVLIAAADRDRSDPVPLRNLLHIAMAQRDNERCIDYCQRLLEIDPNDREALSAMATLRY